MSIALSELTEGISEGEFGAHRFPFGARNICGQQFINEIQDSGHT